jgi:hypothetical protein
MVMLYKSYRLLTNCAIKKIAEQHSDLAIVQPFNWQLTGYFCLPRNGVPDALCQFFTGYGHEYGQPSRLRTRRTGQALGPLNSHN